MHETNGVLSPAQLEELTREARAVQELDLYRKELVRRRSVAIDFRGWIERTGLLRGRVLGRDDLADLVRLERRIQNLNPIVLPKLLGTSTYYRAFKGFEGDEAAFVAHLRERRGGADVGAGHPGVELEPFSRDLAALLSAPDGGLGSALEHLLEHPGAGPGMVTGAMALHEPARHPLVNGGSTALFDRGGRYELSRAVRKELVARARARFGGRPGMTGAVRRVLMWTEFLRALRSDLGFEDFHGLDWFLWKTGQGIGESAELSEDDRTEALLERVDEQLAGVEPERIAVRRRAIEEARALIESRLGRLSQDELRRLFGLFNRDWTKGREIGARFAPAFLGPNMEEPIAAAEALNAWIARLWRAPHDELAGLLGEFWISGDVPRAGRGLPTMILHVRDPRRYHVLMTSTGQGYTRLTGRSMSKRAGALYLQFSEFVAELCESRGIDPELADLALLIVARAEDAGPSNASEPSADGGREFRGFSRETFEFLSNVAQRDTTWVEAHLDTFREHVREPLRALVADVGREFVAVHAPDLEREPKAPNTLSILRKNLWGRKETGAYWSHLWAAFHRRERKKTEDFQLHLAVLRDRFRVGFFTVAATKEERELLRRRLLEDRDLAELSLRRAREVSRLQVGDDEDWREIPTADELADLVVEEKVFVGIALPAEDERLRSEQLVDIVVDVLAGVLPLYLLATHPDPARAIRDLEEEEEVDPPGAEAPAYGLDQLLDETLLDERQADDLRRLLEDKRQLVLYGPPGTGKTWVAERFARHFAGAAGEVRTVQFHPSYSYEDFVEGIRPRVRDGLPSYEVVPGVFRRLCDEARRRPSVRYVLVVDEINRGNLPRIFGELLYLLERRGKEVVLPISGDLFSVPPNVFLLGTMNTADQSIALLDVALRRRFHFYRCDPSPELLGEWLTRNRPPMVHVSSLLRRLNIRLLELGVPQERHIGHSHFMHRGLDDAQLEMIWNHSVLPVIEEYFYGQGDQSGEFQLDRLLAKVDVGAELEAEAAEDDADDAD